MHSNDQAITESLLAGDKDAAALLVDEYAQRIYNVALSITGSPSDAEEIVNDVCLAVCNTVPPTVPENLLAYVLGITRRASLRRVRYTRSIQRDAKKTLSLGELDGVLTSATDTFGEVEARRLKEELNRWVASLNKTDRYIFVRRFWYCDRERTVAEAIGLSESSVSRRLTKMKKQLKKYLSERGFEV